ncbi:unnamed protein product [Ectocarpus sp. 8 AP-2014]
MTTIDVERCKDLAGYTNVVADNEHWNRKYISCLASATFSTVSSVSLTNCIGGGLPRSRPQIGTQYSRAPILTRSQHTKIRGGIVLRVGVHAHGVESSAHLLRVPRALVVASS